MPLPLAGRHAEPVACSGSTTIALRAGGIVARPVRGSTTSRRDPLLAWERRAIVELFDFWGEIDRSHRKLAHLGSRLEKVFVFESTVLRVLRAENPVVSARPPREPVAARPWPQWVEYRPCQVWGHDFSAFMAADRDALAILDLVSRKWITTLLVTHSRANPNTSRRSTPRRSRPKGSCSSSRPA
jgi:hypothetical protein